MVVMSFNVVRKERSYKDLCYKIIKFVCPFGLYIVYATLSAKSGKFHETKVAVPSWLHSFEYSRLSYVIFSVKKVSAIRYLSLSVERGASLKR